MHWWPEIELIFKSTYEILSLMNKSTYNLSTVLDKLTQAARLRGLNDSEWAARASLPKETLSRLRRRDSCDFRTLLALANAVDVRLATVDETLPALTHDGHFPAEMDREYEEKLLRLCASRSLTPQQWAAVGPRFFMAGLAVMVASMTSFDRRGLLSLAEHLCPGAGEPEVFARWLKRSPLRPARFLPMLKHAA